MNKQNTNSESQSERVLAIVMFLVSVLSMVTIVPGTILGIMVIGVVATMAGMVTPAAIMVGLAEMHGPAARLAKVEVADTAVKVVTLATAAKAPKVVTVEQALHIVAVDTVAADIVAADLVKSSNHTGPPITKR